MFPERLKALRKEAGYPNQTSIAKELHISQQTYSQWESGKRNPSKSTLETLANFFNVSTDYLLGKTDIKNSSQLSEEQISNILKHDVVSYDGKPMTDHDRDLLTQIIKDFYDGQLKEHY